MKCVDVVKNADGEITEVHCSYDPQTKSGQEAAQRKVKGTIHWVSCTDAEPAEVRLFDRQFTVADPGSNRDGRDYHEFLNSESLVTAADCRVEPALANCGPGECFQFERLGYFVTDSVDSKPGKPVFNRIVTLRDSWAKIEKAEMAELNRSR